LITVKLSLDHQGNVNTTQVNQSLAETCNDARLVWIDLNRSDTGELERLGKKLGLHHLSLEDASKGRQRPKIDIYDEHVFVVFYAVSVAEDRLDLTEIAIFLGPRFVVTVHDQQLDVLEDVAERWNEANWSKKKDPHGLLLYGIIDAIVDDYFPVIDTLGDRIEQLENVILDGHAANNRSEIFSIRRDCQMIRRIVSPERDVVNHLLRRDTPMFDRSVITNFGDVYDHLLRTYDWLETYRDQMSTLLDLQQAAASNNLNQTMKTLTISSILLMTASLVAGIYGMNFTHMPELHWYFGYPMALVLMLVLAGTLVLYFRQRHWL
jgi:magnesium transporter